MPNSHFDVSIVQRSKRQSAIASAAYQSGDRLYSEYDLKYKDYRQKEHVVYTEILLPVNAPPSYADRETLWNEAEKVEKQYNSQLARKIVLTLPREVQMEHYPQMVREYCEEHFVSKGMCCDLAIHDPEPPGHNPHCHVQLTMRAFDTHGNWLPKSRKVYDLDDNGARIRLPSGAWKSHKEKTVDWDEQYHCEEWRHGWETVQNRYLEMVQSKERVDLRSYERQGVDTIPTVHMGPAVAQMERRGIQTNIGNLNRDIRAVNRLLRSIRETIRLVQEWISALLEARRRLIEELNAEPPTLSGLIQKYSPHEKEAIAHLNEHHIQTAEELERSLQETETRVTLTSAKMKNSEKRLRTISDILRANETCEKHEIIHKKFLKMFWKGQKEKYAAEHKKELDAYNRALRYLKKMGMELPLDTQSLQHEYAKLKLSHTELSYDLKSMKQDLVQLDEIRMCVDDLMEQQGIDIPIPDMPEELEAKPKKEQPRHEERTENAMQAYMRHLKDAREQQKKQRTERKRTGDMER
ncbi:MAG: conjugal transfer protein [Ruminococcaceae bacterium]|nr:conjugal transfer protein [Oscillospiraceae bacterium]